MVPGGSRSSGRTQGWALGRLRVGAAVLGGGGSGTEPGRTGVSQSLCRWRRNQDGAICRRSIKKVLEVLVVKHVLAEHWALPGVSHQRPPCPCHSSSIRLPTHTQNGTRLRPLLGSPGPCPWFLMTKLGTGWCCRSLELIPGRWAALALHPKPRGSHVRGCGSEHWARKGVC